MPSKLPRLKYEITEIFCRSRECTYYGLGLKSGRLVRNGFSYRKSDSRWIQVYRCQACRKKCSEGSTHPCFRQLKRRLNLPIFRDMVSGVSQRRIALKLGISRTTVARKYEFISRIADVQNQKFLLLQSKKSLFNDVLFDEMRSSIHTKCKPVSIPLLVDRKSRFILDLDVCSMPANGPLAEISRRKYGPQADDRKNTQIQLFRRLRDHLHPQSEIMTDQDVIYPDVIKQYLPCAKHTRVKSRRACVVGQGELKKVGFDPLFSLNHTAAMIRANINRLFRRTWCTSKRMDRLKEHLITYQHAHNQMILMQMEKSRAIRVI